MITTASQDTKTGIIWWQALILVALYVVHLLIMKYNKLYQKLIRHKIISMSLERQLRNQAKKDIKKFHRNLQVVCIPDRQLDRGELLDLKNPKASSSALQQVNESINNIAQNPEKKKNENKAEVWQLYQTVPIQELKSLVYRFEKDDSKTEEDEDEEEGKIKDFGYIITDDENGKDHFGQEEESDQEEQLFKKKYSQSDEEQKQQNKRDSYKKRKSNARRKSILNKSRNVDRQFQMTSQSPADNRILGKNSPGSKQQTRGSSIKILKLGGSNEKLQLERSQSGSSYLQLYYRDPKTYPAFISFALTNGI